MLFVDAFPVLYFERAGFLSVVAEGLRLLDIVEIGGQLFGTHFLHSGVFCFYRIADFVLFEWSYWILHAVDSG